MLTLIISFHADAGIAVPKKTLIAPSLFSLPTRYTVSGTVKDKKTGEVLIGATVLPAWRFQNPQQTAIGYGFFSISAPSGSYNLITSFAGYLTDTVKIQLDQNISTIVELRPKNG